MGTRDRRLDGTLVRGIPPSRSLTTHIRIRRVQWQILGPLVLLQAVNLFWYFLIWRTLIRCATPLIHQQHRLSNSSVLTVWYFRGRSLMRERTTRTWTNLIRLATRKTIDRLTLRTSWSNQRCWAVFIRLVSCTSTGSIDIVRNHTGWWRRRTSSI